MSTAFENQVVLSPDWNGAAMTPEEFDAVQWDENYVYELINGVVIVAPPPLEAERSPNDELGHLLRAYRDQHRKGKVLDDTQPEQLVRVGKSRRRADRVIWARLGRVPIPTTDVPTVVVEFVSKGKRNRLRDYQQKRREYRKIGVAEYWITDRFRRTMTVYRLHGTQHIVHEGESYRTPLLPGFELPLDRLLAAADRWRE
jgi:Uma2 family endonuclease